MGRLYIAFDDTDNLDSPGTGHLLEDFLQSLNVPRSFISRHQLFFSPLVPYTSHNSSMCAEIYGGIEYEELIQKGSEYLETRLAPGADPGLCAADPERLSEPELLPVWGYRAKKEVLTKADAYALAERCRVHLSEHGGTGQGVVGALAAVGLRLAGQDGRVKGKKTVSRPVLTASELLEETGFQRAAAYGEGEIPGDSIIYAGDGPVKAVYQNFKSTVLTVRYRDGYRLLTKDLVKCY